MSASPQFPQCVVGGLLALIAVALLATPVEAAKPPPPSTPDPCASASPSYAQNWAGFPAFAYVINTRQTNQTPSTYEIRLGSRNGVCSKRVGSIQPGTASGTSFARNGAEYVIAWGTGSRAMLTRFHSTLATPTASSIPATFDVFRTSAGGLDLSPDGTFLAYIYFGADYPILQIRVADLGVMDVTGTSDANLQSFAGQNVSVWWAPWGKLYYNPMDATNGKRLRALDPSLPATQVPDTLLTIPAAGPIAVNTLFQIGQLTGGYLSSIPAVVFQGYYSTGSKMGGASGSWCVAAYAIDANGENPFLLGTPELPSSIVGFDISVVTADSTVLYNKSTPPKSGSTCTRINYLGESSLDAGSSPLIVGQVQGSWPAALKQ